MEEGAGKRCSEWDVRRQSPFHSRNVAGVTTDLQGWGSLTDGADHASQSAGAERAVGGCVYDCAMLWLTAKPMYCVSGPGFIALSKRSFYKQEELLAHMYFSDGALTTGACCQKAANSFTNRL